MSQDERLIQELEQIRKRNGGKAPPAKILEFARDRNTAWHQHLEWNNKAAGDLYRLLQIRWTIRRIKVTVANMPNIKINAYVSLSSDRHDGGGYRAIEDVMASEALYQEALEDAINDLKRIEERYRHLKELAPVFMAVQRVWKKILEPAPTKSMKTGSKSSHAAA